MAHVKGRALAEAVGHQFLAGEAMGFIPCGINIGQSGTGTGFSSSTFRFYHFSLIFIHISPTRYNVIT